MKTRTRLSYALAFFLSLFISIILIFMGFMIGFGDKELFRSTVSSSKYYETLGHSLELKTKRNLEQYDIPTAIGDDLWSQVEIYRDISQYIKNVLFKGNNQNEVPDYVEHIRQEISKRLDDYYVMSKPCEQYEWNQIKNEITSMVVVDYHHSTRLPLLDEYPMFYSQLLQYSIPIQIVCGVLGLGICVLLFFMYRHKYRSIRYIYYALFSGSLITIMMNSLLQWQMTLKPDYILNKGYVDLCNEMLGKVFEQANFSAYMGLIMGMILLGTVLWMKEKKK